MTEVFLLNSLNTIIGRKKELRAIEAALASSQYGQVLYFEGQGGIGKTQLLTKTRELGQQIEHVLSTDVIDLYLTRYHQPLAIMWKIVSDLREGLKSKGHVNNFFAHFEESQKQFLSMRNTGIDAY